MERKDDKENVLPFLRPQFKSPPAELANDAVVELRQNHPEVDNGVGRAWYHQRKSAAVYPGDGYIDDADVQADPPAPPRYMPVEADDALRKQIEADPTIDFQHLETLDDLKRLLASDAEKTRIFCGTLDEEAMDVLDHLLVVAIREIEVKCATVVEVVNVLILAMLTIRVALRRNELHRLIP